MVATTILTVVIVLFAIYKYYTRSQKLGHVPGPPTLPLIGNLHQLIPKKMIYVLADMARDYGPVMRLRLLNEDVLIVSSKDAAMEALSKSDDFSGRSPFFRILALTQGRDRRASLINGDYNDTWRTNRKVAFKVLHAHGEGMQRIQSIIQNELDEMMQVLAETKSKAVDPIDVCCDSVINMMCIMLTGDRYPYDSAILRQWKRYNDAVFKILDVAGGAAVDFMPWLRHFPVSAVQHVMDNIKIARQETDCLLNLLFKNFKWGTFDENKVGIINDMFREQIAYGKDVYTDNMISDTVLSFISAGTQTSSYSIYAFLLLMTVHSECQKRMAKELEEVVGNSRLPSLSDKEKLPYTQAVLREVLRYVTVAPATLYHRAIRDTSVQGYRVPKDTKMIVNLWTLNHDPKRWKEPDSFNPENFLKDGKFDGFDSSHSYMVFGVGKRSCVGESFAKSRIFLVCCSIIQHFQLLPPEDGKLPSCMPRDWINSGVNMTPPYRIRFVPRQ